MYKNDTEQVTASIIPDLFTKFVKGIGVKDGCVPDN